MAQRNYAFSGPYPPHNGSTPPPPEWLAYMKEVAAFPEHINARLRSEGLKPQNSTSKHSEVEESISKGFEDIMGRKDSTFGDLTMSLSHDQHQPYTQADFLCAKKNPEKSLTQFTPGSISWWGKASYRRAPHVLSGGE